MPRRAGALALAVLAAGCSGTATAHGPDAPVSGRLIMSGGPSQTSNRGIKGEVTWKAGAVQRSIRTAVDGTFRTSLPAGIYTVIGTSPLYNSSQGRCFTPQSHVEVTATGVTGVVVVCSIK